MAQGAGLIHHEHGPGQEPQFLDQNPVSLAKGRVGRVGRGTAQSVCILLYAQPLGELARARLKVIFESSDGFEIAREDLRLRGPGEFVGSRQSGLPLLRYADLEDAALVEQARAVAEDMLHNAPQAAAAHLQRWLGGREELLKA